MKPITTADIIEAWKVYYESSEMIQEVLLTYDILQNFHVILTKVAQ